MPVDFRNIQGLIVQTYRCPLSRHLLFRFQSKEAGQAFLRPLLDLVTTADRPLDGKPEPLLNIGLTAGGLRMLGTAEALLESFDAAFVDGPDPVIMGDVFGSASDPTHWWEARFKTPDIHAIVHLFTLSPDILEAATQQVRTAAAQGGIEELTPRLDGTSIDGQSLGGRKLHFDYTDGISQPPIAWDDQDNTPGLLNYRHFVLGYSTPEIPSAPRKEPAAALARDGSFEVFRWLYQDVATFNRFLTRSAPLTAPNLSLEEGRELVAAKMMGRWRDGTPLVLSPDKPDPNLASENGFQYAQADPNGFRCPFSSHVRVTNPRDQALDPIVTEGVPRVLRRGMPYGPRLEGEIDDGVDRGVIGMFLCTDIRRQFYTLMNWMKRNSFSPVFDADRRTQDPLVGNRSLSGSVADFHIPAAGGDTTLTGLPDFLRTKGTAFFLLPSLSTLRTLANGMTR